MISKRAFLIVDVQNDFIPGGSLAVEEGEKVVPVINELQDAFLTVVATQDWHPANHLSFASNHSNRKPMEKIELGGQEQILWPNHCVQNTKGAEFVRNLRKDKIEKIFKKGDDPKIDSYSGFFDNGHKRDTGLDSYLKSKGIERVYIAGLAADFCVKYTALDALMLGYKTYVIEDATRAVGKKEGLEQTKQELEKNGIEFIHSKQLYHDTVYKSL